MILKAITTSLLRFSTPFHRLPVHLPRSNLFLTKHVALFSTDKPDKYHPIVEDLRQIDKEKDLEELLTQMTTLNQFNLQAALRIILDKVYMGILPPRVLIDSRFVVHLRKNPALHFEGIFLRIKDQLEELDNFLTIQNEKGSKIAVKDINECFVLCFDTIRKIPRADALRKEVQLHRKFADYHANYLLKMIQPAKRNEILTKSSDFYRSALNKTSALLKQEEERLRKQKELMLEMNETQQQRDDKIVDIRDGIFQIVESTAESVFNLLKVQNYISNPAYHSKPARRKLGKQQANPPPFAFHDGLYELLPFFRKAVEYYKMIDPEQYPSINSIKLKKLTAQMTYYHRVSQLKDKSSNHAELQKKEWITLEHTLEEVYKECGRDLNRICNTSAPNSEQTAHALSMIMISIKLHSIERSKPEYEEYKQRLVAQVKKIGEFVANEPKRKVILLHLAKLSKQVLQVNTDGELGKESRGLKYNRRLKW